MAELATEIWTEHFPPIIGAAQTVYMIKTFQSAEAVRRQITEDGYQYYLLQSGSAIGSATLLFILSLGIMRCFFQKFISERVSAAGVFPAVP
ncbi:MAG TPA: hypothetical protein O0X38_02255 [Methanocorpusculum sp.]|nr:hypothetical protein [Methanocorpusculum sp.]